MENKLTIYNTLSRQKELFVPLHAPHVGMYVCGPTVYGDAHLGHARPAITFDILFRYLTHLGYKVRYVRNITDVGHLEHDADEGEDKIAKKARLEQLEPMEVVQYYLNRYHKAMEALNVLPPSIEPHASGHIIEQIELVEEILKNGYAYESEGSVYFDVAKYNKDHHYGKLSGRNLDDVLNTTRELDGQSEKRNPADFALWKCAQPEHIMRWPSPWSNGFPGWHCECTAMGKKYLGEHFDIHGGGMDLIFPHHECEIAQSVASQGDEDAKYLRTITYRAEDFVPVMACPSQVDKIRDTSVLEGTPIDQVFIGSCTNGRLEDLQAAAEVLKGKKVADYVKLIVTPASRKIYLQASKMGILDTLAEAGAMITHPGCGLCCGRAGGILSDGERVVATNNRNFLGRMGTSKVEIYLASPKTAAACAVAGKIVTPEV